MKTWIICLTIISIILFKVFGEVNQQLETNNDTKYDRISQILNQQ